MPAHGRPSPPRPLPVGTRRQRRRWPGCRTRQPPGPRMRGRGRAGEAAPHAPGARTRAALAASPPPAAGAGPVGAGPRAPPLREAGDRLLVDAARRAHPEADHGWRGLATTGSAQAWPEAEVRRASQEQHTTVARGCRWSKQPAAIRPGWLEPPARMAVLAMRTGVGVLGYRLLQRPVRLALLPHHQQGPGPQGTPATPTAAGGCAVFAPGALLPVCGGTPEVGQMYGRPPYP